MVDETDMIDLLIADTIITDPTCVAKQKNLILAF
jgi:hypothetical protein